ncbi:MAG: glycogen synthase GlgA [bacterium]
MKILYVASEVAPFIKTGGLADVAGALPKTLAKKGEDIRVVLPLYKNIAYEHTEKMKLIAEFEINVAWRKQYCGVLELVQDDVVYYFIDNKHYFGRDGIYGYDDDAERFAYFSRAVIEMLKEIQFQPDVINANDWQSALIPSYLKLQYGFDIFYKDVKSIITIHNIAYQGRFGKHVLQDVVGISDYHFDNGFFEQDGDVNFLKAAIVAADAVTTVSKTYADEIKYDYHGHELHHILKQNESKLHGILNGIDVDIYNPETHESLFFNYNHENLENKEKNKQELLKRVSLKDAGEDTPVIGIISRFVDHKGFDLVEKVLEDILSYDIKLVVLGTGDFRYEQMFHQAKRNFPSKISVNIAFSEDLANKIYAGCDMFLMPSKSEPCGLAQMISMRYGTIPIVRETGGLADTVKPYRKDLDEGNGFTFKNINAHDMLFVVREACGFYKNDRERWNSIVKRNMQEDFSWDKSAGEYLDVYNSLLK